MTDHWRSVITRIAQDVARDSVDTRLDALWAQLPDAMRRDIGRCTLGAAIGRSLFRMDEVYGAGLFGRMTVARLDAEDAAMRWLAEHGIANAAPQDGPPQEGVPSSGRAGDNSEERTGHKAEDTT